MGRAETRKPVRKIMAFVGLCLTLAITVYLIFTPRAQAFDLVDAEGNSIEGQTVDIKVL